MVAGNFGENTLRVGGGGRKVQRRNEAIFISGKLHVRPITPWWVMG